MKSARSNVSHDNDLHPIKCNLCSSKSYIIEEYLNLDDEYFKFKCSNKKCGNTFIMDYNSYVYCYWEQLKNKQ